MRKEPPVPLLLFLLLSFLISLGWGNYVLLERDATNLLDSANLVQEALAQENWPLAEQHLQETVDKWERHQRYWPMLINHAEMDRIEDALAKLKSYLQYRDTSNAAAQLKALIYYIRHIPQKEEFSLQNIF